MYYIKGIKLYSDIKNICIFNLLYSEFILIWDLMLRFLLIVFSGCIFRKRLYVNYRN